MSPSPVVKLGRPNRWLSVGLLALAGTIAAWPSHAQEVYTRDTVTVFAGPSPDGGIVAQWPARVPVTLYGCLDDRSWCQAAWGASQGWVFAGSLVRVEGNTWVEVADTAWAVPVIVINGGYYGGYRGNPWRPPPPRWDHDHDGHGPGRPGDPQGPGGDHDGHGGWSGGPGRPGQGPGGHPGHDDGQPRPGQPGSPYTGFPPPVNHLPIKGAPTNGLHPPVRPGSNGN